jgi:hypothetical protein
MNEAELLKKKRDKLAAQNRRLREFMKKIGVGGGESKQGETLETKDNGHG